MTLQKKQQVDKKTNPIMETPAICSKEYRRTTKHL
jgi:hypothetical protein